MNPTEVRVLKRAQPESRLSREDEAWLKQKIAVFRHLIGTKELALVAKQAEVVAEISERLEGLGLVRLRLETGLNDRRIFSLLHFHKFLPLEECVEDLPVDYHLLVAYHYGNAVDTYGEQNVRAGHPPWYWLKFARQDQDHWTCEQLEKELLRYYGTYPNLKLLENATVRFREAQEQRDSGLPPSRVPRAVMLPVAQTRLEDWQRRRKIQVEAKRVEPGLPPVEEVLESIDGFVRMLKRSFQPAGRVARNRELIFDRLEELVHREIPELLRVRKKLLLKWGPGGFCFVCTKRENPHYALGYCNRCFKEGQQKDYPDIVRYLKRHRGRPLRRR